MAYGSLLTDTVQSSTTGTPPQFNDGSGTQVGTLCRAWVNYNGVTPAISASFNVSSVTRNGTGDYTVNFSTAMTDANYATMTCGTLDVASSAAQYWAGIRASSGTPTTKTTSAVRVQSLTSATGAIDTQQYSVAIFR